MRRVDLLVTGFLLGIVLAACHKQVKADAKYEVVHRGSYAYQKVNDGEYVVAAANGPAMDRALEEIGCAGKKAQYVCLVQPDGELYSVQLQRK